MQVEHLITQSPAVDPKKVVAGALRRFGLAVPLLALAACGGAEPGFLALTAATSTVINSDKLPTDFIADAVTGLDCNTIRQSVDKGPLCRAPEQRVIERPLYCYRTLGTINCYDQPDPYRDGAEQVSGTLP